MQSRLNATAANTIVFFTSAVVMVLEILASRLLAPYIGVTLEAYTSVIGTALAGISAGTWFGGRLADRRDARTMLGLLLLFGGAAVLLTVPAARWFGPTLASQGATLIIGLTVLTLFLPAALLSAVNPTVVKLHLRDLESTGSVVGRLSALGTAGAIIGTFATGFILVGSFAMSSIIVATGLLLVVIGGVTTVVFSKRTRRGAIETGVIATVVGLSGSFLTLSAESPCDKESSYYCIEVENDPNNANGRFLKLDDIYHAYADLNDPQYLRFKYTQVVGDIVDNFRPSGNSISALSLGGGGFTIARYISSTRPQSTSDVIEIDPAILETAKSDLGLKDDMVSSIHIGDARARIDDIDNDEYDFVFGDAFGSESVPWQLTTREFVSEIDRVTKPDGVYVMNIIDFRTLAFVRAEVETLKTTFDNVVLVGFPGAYKGVDAGNVELIATDAPVNANEIATWFDQSVEIKTGVELDEFVAGSPILTDDFAPVDQLKGSSRFLS